MCGKCNDRVIKIADIYSFRGPTKHGKTDLSEAESYLVGVPTSATALTFP